jgi:hypothetical protein
VPCHTAMMRAQFSPVKQCTESAKNKQFLRFSGGEDYVVMGFDAV